MAVSNRLSSYQVWHIILKNNKGRRDASLSISRIAPL